MTRIDFWHGVTILSFFLLVLFIIQIFGYLDKQTYYPRPFDSLYELSTELSLVYMNYQNLLIAFCILLSLLLVLICKPLDEHIMWFHPHCYRPYFPYHSTICLVPFILRQLYTTNNASDDIMYLVEWNGFFLVISSILQFIRSYWLFVVKKCKLNRMGYSMIKTSIRLIVFIFFCICCRNGLELLNRVNVSKEFMTVWSYFDHGSLFEDLNVNTNSTNARSFSLDQNLFQETGQKVYRTLNSWSYNAGDKMPIQRKTYFVGIGESVSLSCHAFIEVFGTVSVLWFFNGRHLRSNDSAFNITTNVEKVILKQEISSRLEIDVIKNNGYGSYACFFQYYESIGEEKKIEIKKPFPSTKNRDHNKDHHSVKMKAFSSIRSIQHNVAQYSVKKHYGKKFFIYATLGGAIDIRWKPMVFNNEIEDVIEYYYVNGVSYNRPKLIGFCSVFSHFYLAFGQASNWFFVPCTSQTMQLYESLNYLETRFTECTRSSVFGVHTVEYFRRVYDKRSKSFVFQKVEHPDTLYVLPDLPYFFKKDNLTKEKLNEVILNLHKLKLDYPWHESSMIDVFWILRSIGEELTLTAIYILIGFFLYLYWKLIDCNIQKILRKVILQESRATNADQSPVTYDCYIICGDTDRNVVYENLVVPLREKNIKTGFIIEECSINKGGSSKFNITRDILKECEHLVFYITSSYLNEEKFVDIDLETVLSCKQNGIVSADRILLIKADRCELPDKLLFNLPNVAANYHDWVRKTKPEERINLILKWIKKEKKDSTTSDTCFVVSTAFLG